jgi:hypothetical protein
MIIFPSCRPARRRKFAGHQLPERAPTDRWRPDKAGVTDARRPCFGL